MAAFHGEITSHICSKNVVTTIQASLMKALILPDFEGESNNVHQIMCSNTGLTHFTHAGAVFHKLAPRG